MKTANSILKSAVFVSATILVFAQAGAQVSSKYPSAATTAGITEQDLRTRLYLFSDDSMEGRDTGREGGRRATNYIARELRRIGVEPAGDSGSYFQTLPLVMVSLDSRTHLTLDGAPPRLGTDFVPVAAAGFLRAPFSGNVGVVYAGVLGDSILARPGSTDGKAVLFDVAQHRQADRRMSGEALASALRDARARFPAAALILIANLDLLSDNNIQENILPHAALTSPPALGVQVVEIAPSIAARIFNAPLRNLTLGAVGKNVGGDITFRVEPTKAPGRNVIGVIRGSDPAFRFQYVALGAHSDHVGIFDRELDHDSVFFSNRVLRPMGNNSSPREPTKAELRRISFLRDSVRRVRVPRRDSIRNGADDDGSGSVALLEMAEAMASAPAPRRSVLFIWHTGEERGLLGSRWFTDHPTVPRDSIIAEVMMDQIGRGSAADVVNGGPKFAIAVGARRRSSEIGALLDSANAHAAFHFAIDYSYDAPGHPLSLFCRSDHYSYARYGIPSVLISTMLHPDYHQVTDEPQYVDYTKLLHVTRLVHGLALQLANLDHRPQLDRPPQGIGAVCVQ